MTDEGEEFDFDPRVTIRNRGEGFVDDDFTAEFFHQFPMERLSRNLAGIDLSAGEFPEAFECLADRTLGDEDLFLMPDEGTDNGDRGGGHDGRMERRRGNATFAIRHGGKEIDMEKVF